MNLFKKLFSGNPPEIKSNIQREATTQSNSTYVEDASKLYYEKDNIGTRIMTADRNQAAYTAWVANGSPPCGSIYYGFNSEEEAFAAMTEIPCIKIAADSKNLVCLEILEFGVYWDSDNNKYWEAFLQGTSLTLSTYKAAETSFINHKGVKLVSVEPKLAEPKKAANTSKADANDSADVKFVCNKNVTMMGITGTKEIYKAPDKSIALEFLKSKTINKPYYFIEIETPNGWVGKDIDGVYQT